ncbi:hypothetical protein AAF712_010078 [Marasmius tenuissimus]|uniref:Nephrocystin 3-like N-terminal domain-containing protein n=1 Tax=Marasmius tenuissimus TaxID=585030 RepID=A0ABR2ZPI1_9AGAR
MQPTFEGKQEYFVSPSHYIPSIGQGRQWPPPHDVAGPRNPYPSHHRPHLHTSWPRAAGPIMPWPNPTSQHAPPPPPQPLKHSMFRGASQFTILGGLFSNVGGDVVNSQHSSNAVDVFLDQYLRGFCSMNAAFNSGGRHLTVPRCAPETRTEVIGRIIRWARSPPSDSTGILWLNGLAGEGKSAIAQTIAEHFSTFESNGPVKLAGSFFFSRGQDDRRQNGTIFATLAYQLTQYHPTLKRCILGALQEDSSIPHARPTEQFAKLVIEPILAYNRHLRAEGERPQTPLFVIDALDECDDPSSVLIAIADALTTHKNLFRFLVTSRPESQLQGLFGMPVILTVTTGVSLRDYDSTRDVELYLSHSFATIRDKNMAIFRALRDEQRQEWPERPILDQLVVESDGLFAYASNIVQYVSHEGDSPIQRLERLLTLRSQSSRVIPSNTSSEDRNSDNPYRPLDQLYMDILSAVKSSPDLLRNVLGILIVLLKPLAEPDLVALVTRPGGELKGDVLLSITSQLHSILLVPRASDDGRARRTQPIKLYHKSIHEFLTDSGRSASFYINPTQKHGDMAVMCLDVMSRELTHDICQIQQLHHGSQTHQPDALRNQHIPGHLRYACCFWWQHMCSAVINGDRAQRFERSLDFFVEFCILKWIECLSLLGELSVALKAIRAIGDHDMRVSVPLRTLFTLARSHVKMNPQSKLKSRATAALADCGWLLLAFYLKLAEAPYSIYDITVNQAPRQSLLRRSYRKHVTWLPLNNSLLGVARTWPEHFSLVISSRYAQSAAGLLPAERLNRDGRPIRPSATGIDHYAPFALFRSDPNIESSGSDMMPHRDLMSHAIRSTPVTFVQPDDPSTLSSEFYRISHPAASAPLTLVQPYDLYYQRLYDMGQTTVRFEDHLHTSIPQTVLLSDLNPLPESRATVTTDSSKSTPGSLSIEAPLLLVSEDPQLRVESDIVQLTEHGPTISPSGSLDVQLLEPAVNSPDLHIRAPRPTSSGHSNHFDPSSWESPAGGVADGLEGDRSRRSSLDLRFPGHYAHSAKSSISTGSHSESDSDSYHTAEEEVSDSDSDDWEWNYSITPPDEGSISSLCSTHHGDEAGAEDSNRLEELAPGSKLTRVRSR